MTKMQSRALAGWLSWLEHHAMDQKGHGFNSWLGYIAKIRAQSLVGVHIRRQETNAPLSLSNEK